MSLSGALEIQFTLFFISFITVLFIFEWKSWKVIARKKDNILLYCHLTRAPDKEGF